MEQAAGENEIILRGVVDSRAVLSHESHGQRFYTARLRVRRLSGAEDTLNLLLGEPLAARLPEPGMPAAVRGQVRTYNNRSGAGGRLQINVHAAALDSEEGDPVNRLRLSGRLCKPPVFRKTPLGREICDLLLAVNRRYGRADYLPCIAWGTLARRCAALSTGAPLSLTGRLQSREYSKTDETGQTLRRTALEVSVMELD